MSADASFRRYFRAMVQGASFILVDAPPTTEKNSEFIEFADQYAQVGIDVPRVIFNDLAQGFLCLTDLGNQSLLPMAENDSIYWYRKALRVLPLLAKVTVNDVEARYNGAFFELELDLFKEWFCQQLLDIPLSDIDSHSLAPCLDWLVKNATAQPQVATHRDFHGRNIMVRDNQSLAVIDFQDTVIGPLTYDVVSLLKDCYFKLDDVTRIQLLRESYEMYRTALSLSMSFDEYRQYADLMGLQRHLKVCGIFSRLHLRDNKSHYLNDLPLVVDYILEVCNYYHELTPLSEFFEKMILPKLPKRIEQCLR